MLRTLFFPLSIALDVGLFELSPTDPAAKVFLVASVLLAAGMWLAVGPSSQHPQASLTQARKLLSAMGYHLEMLHHRLPKDDFVAHDISEKSVLLLRSAEETLDGVGVTARTSVLSEDKRLLLLRWLRVLWSLMILAGAVWIAVAIGRQ
jgi:hypothetical protein